MKASQILLVGVIGFIVVMVVSSFQVYALLAAMVVLAMVILGFKASPARDTYYIRTTRADDIPFEAAIDVAHDCIAVRVHVARLWILFVPTFAAVAVLLMTAAHGAPWFPRLIDTPYSDEAYGVFIYAVQPFLVLVFAMVSGWVGERFVLRNAEACSARYIQTPPPRVAYSFVDRSGGFYGGVALVMARAAAPEIARLVFYNVTNPQLNRLAIGMFFHRVEIIGRGIPDFAEATVAVETKKPVPSTN